MNSQSKTDDEKILVFIYCSEINNLHNFQENCLDKDIINKIIEIKDPINILNDYFNLFTQYDYLLYINDNYTFNKQFYIKDYIKILKTNIYHQVFLTQNTYKDYNTHDNIIEPTLKTINTLTKRYVESSLTILENSLKLNPPRWCSPSGGNNTGIDYLEYINNDEIFWPYFNLKPSLIKTEIFKKLNNIELSCLYFDRNFSNKYSEYFKSCYLSNFVCSKINISDQKKGNKDDMTIVTGFINIPNKNNKVKTHCSKKHTYSYEEKSIPTLKIKQKMVVYIPENLYDHVYKIRESIGYIDKTKIIIIKDTFLYMHQHIEKITDNCKKNINTYKNPYYICAVSTRYNIIREAIKNNFFKTNYFTWVDFGLSHCVDIYENQQFTYNLKKFRISWIARYNKKNYFDYNHFVLGGGIFGGHKEVFKKICDLHDQIFMENTHLGYNCNDDKTLWFIFERYPELFDTYFSGYKNIVVKYSK